MFIYVDPSELRNNSLFPKDIDIIPCPSLETETGADFVISRAPIPPTTSLDLHINTRSLFCQRKSGYDTLGDFNQIWIEIGRMKSIPMQQCFILPIGQFSSAKDGSLRILGKKKPANLEKVSYLTYLKNEAEWGYSGVQVRRLNDEDELSLFIQAQIEELQRIEDRDGLKEVWSKGTQAITDDPFQDVKEIEDWRLMFLSGIKGIGLKTVQNIQAYIDESVEYIKPSGYSALKIITDEYENGKPIYNVQGIGPKMRKQVREMLGLKDKENLSKFDPLSMTDYAQGWDSALNAFKMLVEDKKKSGAEAWKQLKNEEIPF